MMRSLTPCLLFAIFALDPAAAQEKPETETVKAGPFKVEASLDGVFEAEEMTEVILRPEVWSMLTVEKAVAQGAHVSKGEPILWLETQKIDDEIRNLEFQRELGRLTIEQTEIEIAALEKSIPLDMEQARRSKQEADEELSHYVTVGESLSRRSAEESLQSSKDNLEATREELDQLEKMYRADDLTEETEEIILKRARRAVERGEFFLESAAVRVERQLGVDIPRERQQVEERAVRAALALAKAQATLPISLQQKRIEQEKLAVAQKELDEKLAKLQADRESLTVKSPAAGILYYGQCERGRWTTGSTIAKQLRKGNSISANQVIMTVVAPGPSFVRVDVPEQEMRHLKPDVEARIVPTAYPDASLPGRVRSIDPIPFKEGVYDGQVAFELEMEKLPLVPGMTCKVIVRAYEKEDALTLPESAVFSEPLDESQKFVYIEEAGEPVKKPVKTGHTSGGRIEITEGINPGDLVRLTKPE